MPPQYVTAVARGPGNSPDDRSHGRLRCPWTSADGRCRHPSRQGRVSRGAGVTKLDLIEYYLAVADGALRGVAGRPMILKRFVKGITEEAVFQKRAPEKRPDWIDVAELKYASGTSAKEAVISRRRGPGVGGQPGLRRSQPPPGAGRRPRSSRRTARRPRPDAGRGMAADRRRGAGGPRRARGPRPDGMAEDVGVAGVPRLRPHRAATGRTSRSGWRRRRSPARSSGARPSWRPAGGGRRNAKASSSTSTRTPRTAPSPRPTRCVAPDARVSTPLRWDEVPDCRPETSPWRRCPSASPSIGDPWEGMDDAAGGLDGSAGAAPRNSGPPRRRRRVRDASADRPGNRVSTMPLIEIARTKTKDEAMAALDEWKRSATRRPPKGWSPSTFWSTACAGRVRSGTAIRINLQHVPEDQRPPQEDAARRLQPLGELLGTPVDAPRLTSLLAGAKPVLTKVLAVTPRCLRSAP